MKRYSATTVMAIVIANMVGTGVFTSLGFQLLDIESGSALLALWVVGGIVALCGAMSYAELGGMFPRSGGEYNLLREAWHPAAGLVSGWISTTVGFTAPVALAALTFTAYGSAVIPWLEQAINQKIAAVALVAALAVVHTGTHRNSSWLQNGLTVLKISVIVAFCFAVATVGGQSIDYTLAKPDLDVMTSNAFAVSLIYVAYAYTGWNVATYLAGEMDKPQLHLPRTLIVSTAIVTALYVMLNAAFLHAAPLDAMRGEIEVGVIAAQAAFGDAGGRLAGGVLALLLISTVSAMTVAGPRVLQVVGEDYPVLGWLARRNVDGIPANAVAVQSAGAMLMILIGNFQSILILTGFALALNSFVTVSSVIALRIRRPALERPFKVPLYPLPPLIYLCLTGWTLYFVFRSAPVEGAVSAVLIGSGLVVYWLSVRLSRGKAL